MIRILGQLGFTVLACSILLAPTQAQSLLRNHTGPSDSAAFGTSSCAADLNGDGVPDLVIGAPGDDAAGVDAGLVSVFSGSDGSALFTFMGDGPGDRFGTSVGIAGDVNGDGTADVIVGAPGDPAGNGTGWARIFSGADGSVLYTLYGAQPGGQFGASVDGALDVDGDGRHDVLVGAPGEDTGGIDTGSAYIISGADGSVLFSASGDETGDGLGTSVSGRPPDVVKGDNEPAVIIGATAGGGDNRGYVQVRLRANFTLVCRVDGLAAGDRLGTSTALAGDVDGDGTGDLLAGTNGGGYALVLSSADGSVLHQLSSGAGVGSAVAGVGDSNGDGYDDIAVSEPLADAHGVDSGTVHVFSGADGSVLDVVHGPGAGAGFGASVTFAGDLDGDGLDDLAVGAPSDDSAGTGCGAVYVLSLTRWEDLGNGLPGVYGVPNLRGQGGLVDPLAASLLLTNARTVTGATLVLGYSLYIDAQHGVLAPTPDIVSTGLLTDAEGNLQYSFEWPAGLPSGFYCYYQFVIDDPAANDGSSRSNTVAAIVP